MPVLKSEDYAGFQVTVYDETVCDDEVVCVQGGSRSEIGDGPLPMKATRS